MDESKRLQSLRRYGVLDTVPEEVFDRVLRLAQAHFNVPMALVGFLDETRHWFKAVTGLELRQIGRDISFCNYTIQGDEVVVVEDTSLDPRLMGNPLVAADPNIRFYAAAPLIVADGACIGTIALLDLHPRYGFSPADRRFLEDLAATIVHELEARVAASLVAAEMERRRQLEIELATAAEQARSATAAKSRFLAAASHDLRQPVQSLALLLGVLKMRLKEQPDAEIAAAAHESLESLRGLLDSLLDISKLEAGLIEVNPRAVPLQPMLDRLMRNSQLAAKAKRLSLRSVRTSAIVQTDPVLLERILRNLLENALRYTPVGGILIGCRRRKGQIRIDVVDTGQGIPPEKIRDIFQEFVQLGNIECDRSQGLGLGLAIVKRLSDMLEHRLDVQSTPGRGTRFSLELPSAEATQTDKTAERRRTELKGTVLVIEDEALVASSFALGLREAGLTVIGADSAKTALDALGGTPPDVILSDFRLRGTATGLEEVRALRQHFQTKTPAIIITGDTAPERLQQAEASGHPLLHKPVSLDDLLNAIGMLIEAS